MKSSGAINAWIESNDCKMLSVCLTVIVEKTCFVNQVKLRLTHILIARLNCLFIFCLTGRVILPCRHWSVVTALSVPSPSLSVNTDAAVAVVNICRVYQTKCRLCSTGMSVKGEMWKLRILSTVSSKNKQKTVAQVVLRWSVLSCVDSQTSQCMTCVSMSLFSTDVSTDQRENMTGGWEVGLVEPRNDLWGSVWVTDSWLKGLSDHKAMCRAL